MHSVLFRVTAWNICSHLPTCGSWGFWWSNSRGKHSLQWRAKWANWSMTRPPVRKEAQLFVSQCKKDVTRAFMTTSPVFCNALHPNPGRLSDAFSSLAKKSHFRAISRRLCLVGAHQDDLFYFAQCWRCCIKRLTLSLYVQVPKSDEEYDLRVPRDMAYIFSGAYIPLSCKLIEQVGKSAGLQWPLCDWTDSGACPAGPGARWLGGT